MPAKRLLFGDEGRARLLAGSRVLAGAVRVTLGPGGRNIFLERPMHSLRHADLRGPVLVIIQALFECPAWSEKILNHPVSVA